MSKRTIFTTISPLPPGVSREVVLDFLYSHVDMIDLNPLVVERHPIEAPPDADPYERDCVWYSLTDRIDYLPGAHRTRSSKMASGNVSYTCAFHDLANGIQTHCRAPLGVDVRDKWTLHGTLPGEPPEPVEIGLGAPASGLYIREDVELRCNILMASFVKKNLKRSHATLVDRLVEKASQVSAEREARGGRGSAQRRSPPSYLPYDSHHVFNVPPENPQATTYPLDDEVSPVKSHEAVRVSTARLVRPYRLSKSSRPTPSHEFSHTQSRSPSQPQVQDHSPFPPLLHIPTEPPSPPTRTAPYPPNQMAPSSPHSQKTPPPPTRTAPPPPPPPKAPLTPPSSPPLTSATTVRPGAPFATSSPSAPYYPAPLRIREYSPRRGHSSSVTSTTSTLPSTLRSSGEYEEHPDYPHLSPYSPAEVGARSRASSGGSSNSSGGWVSPDELLPPRTPAFMWRGYDDCVVFGPGPGPDGTLEYPSCLRPGSGVVGAGGGVGSGAGCRLDGPFIAELA